MTAVLTATASAIRRVVSDTAPREEAIIAALEVEGLSCMICANIPKEPAKIELVGGASHCTSLVVCVHSLFLNAVTGRSNGSHCLTCNGSISKVEVNREQQERIQQIIGGATLSDEAYCSQRINPGTSIPLQTWSILHRIFGTNTARIAREVGVVEESMPEDVRSGLPPPEETREESTTANGTRRAREFLGQLCRYFRSLGDDELDTIANEMGPLFEAIDYCWPQISECVDGCTPRRVASCIAGILGAIAGTVVLVFAGLIGGAITIMGVFRR